MSWMVGVIRLLIRSYQLLLSPWSGGACRFSPSCSEFAEEAVRTHGARRGLWLAFRRVLHCHPFGRSGFDPVPPVDHQASANSLQAR